MEIHLFREGYCGLSRVEGGLINVCLLIRREFLQSLSAPRWDEVCGEMRARSASLRERLPELVPAEEDVHAVAGLGFSPKEASRGSVLFLGDAAGMIAPLCGDGQAMALESAVRLADAIGGFPARMGDGDLAALARGWDAAWTGRFSRRLWLGKLLQSSLLRVPAAEASVRLASALPRLASALVRATRGGAP